MIMSFEVSHFEFEFVSDFKLLGTDLMLDECDEKVETDDFSA
jgi:hypothetical protein